MTPLSWYFPWHWSFNSMFLYAGGYNGSILPSMPHKERNEFSSESSVVGTWYSSMTSPELRSFGLHQLPADLDSLVLWSSSHSEPMSLTYWTGQCPVYTFLLFHTPQAASSSFSQELQIYAGYGLAESKCFSSFSVTCSLLRPPKSAEQVSMVGDWPTGFPVCFVVDDKSLRWHMW